MKLRCLADLLPMKETVNRGYECSVDLHVMTSSHSGSQFAMRYIKNCALRQQLGMKNGGHALRADWNAKALMWYSIDARSH